MYCKVHFGKITGSNCPLGMMLIRKYCLPYQSLTGTVKEDHALRFNFLPARTGKKTMPKTFAENLTWVEVLGKVKDQNAETAEVKINKFQT